MTEQIDQFTGEITQSRDPIQVLTEWELAKVQMEQSKQLEVRLRNEYVALVSDPNKVTGTENIQLAAGYKAKIVKKQNHNVNQDTVNTALDKIENDSAEGKLLADRLIKWKAELSKTEYDQLPPKYKAMIDDCITVTPGTPTLEIVAPKTQGKL
jgi:hypothetical protein